MEMSMFALDIVVVAMLASQAPTASPAADPPVDSQVVVTGPNRPPSERRICRLVEQTNSRIAGARVCHTRVEWEEERRLRQVDARDTLSNIHDRLDQEAPRRPNPASTPR
jgi:hypothetical protein